MSNAEPVIPRKWALRAHGRHNIFTKGPQESARHVIMKAMLWALYLPQYPTMSVEVRIGDKYKPDLVAFGAEPALYTVQEHPLFWGESGVVGLNKIRSLVRRYPETHFAIAKWETTLRPHTEIVKKALNGYPRAAPFDLLRIPADAASRFIDADGEIHVRHDDLDWLRLS
jgi:hypothetical protein